MRTYYIFILLLLIPILSIKAQIGVNTETPEVLLDVVSSTPTGMVLITSNSDNKETMQIRNDGYIGMGVANPLVKLDLRSTTLAQENALGIGYTSQTAAQAQAGAIRYNPTYKTLEYSDGTMWIRLQANPDKAMVIAKNSSGKEFVVRTTGNVVSGVIENWTKVYDKTGNFNATTGRFTATRDGIYSVSVTGVFPNTSLPQGSQYELSLSASSGTTLKCVVPYLSEVSNGNLTNSCKGLFKLSAGQTIVPTIYISGTYVNQKLSTDASLNMITIAEM